ncbi:LacI family DNA-binding transcriptional regulator [uncultured Anaerococcus sp.]|uniref:LacI family DNA-binding transcriptional regulator n=1 Tax=uncultured Anaerococcus sp. TaxID=293428 RepID=UPI0025D7017E|nr:LacI family DNA-binding transcriptional regulator [uncultured Anaerococcus sp.]
MTNKTIKDIASLCGVSISTVSRAINNTKGISPVTRARILDTIEKVGYEPNHNARNLKISKNKTIAVLIKGITNPFFTPMIKVIEEEISKTGYSFVLTKVEEHSSELDVAQKMVSILKPEGIIFLGGYTMNNEDELKSLCIPYSMTTIVNKGNTNEESICVGVDDFKEAYKMTSYLTGLGHRKIALIAAREDDLSIGNLRLEGYKKALADSGIDFDENLIIYPRKGLNPYSSKNGYEVGEKIVKNKIDCTAIFAISDSVAIGAIKALNDLGKKVPEDFSVAGFDGLDINNYLPKPITTIIQPTEKIAYTSVNELFKIINKKKHKQVISFDAELFTGETTIKNNKE